MVGGASEDNADDQTMTNGMNHHDCNVMPSGSCRDCHESHAW